MKFGGNPLKAANLVIFEALKNRSTKFRKFFKKDTLGHALQVGIFKFAVKNHMVAMETPEVAKVSIFWHF